MKSILLAQSINIGGTTIKGPLDGTNIIGKKIETLGDMINVILPFTMSLAGILLFLILMWGGYDFMMSQGDPAKMKSARAKITAGVVGFILLMLSYLITKLVSYIFGVGEGIV